jgi:hypothetical protein
LDTVDGSSDRAAGQALDAALLTCRDIAVGYLPKKRTMKKYNLFFSLVLPIEEKISSYSPPPKSGTEAGEPV